MESSKTNGDLKKPIKTEKDPELTMATNKLYMVIDANSPEDMIHVIVQPRPQAMHPRSIFTVALCMSLPFSSPCSYPSFPTFAQPMNRMGRVLVERRGILETVNCHHITHDVDPNDVKAVQSQGLRPIYKNPLPYRKRATDTSLVMLKLGTDKQAKLNDDKTLRLIMEASTHLDQFDRRCMVVATVSPSGSGKTAILQNITLSFIVLIGNVEVEFLVRLFSLQLLLNYNRDLEPLQFFLEQINGGALNCCLAGHDVAGI
ncbi:MAG: hypothetical protein J3R72DRAFT_498763 [Linnemannia gamsii]|nr:MAG: hypothetical protein J3R72DRAFT_498763 [Linnemannia gamsii]